jgi:outer membrane receptor protein involved in Fe transport
MLSCAIAAILSGAGSALGAADASAQSVGTSSATPQAVPARNTAQAAGGNSAPAGLDQIVVTAQRRNESVQKVPMTVQALSGATLDRLNIQSFDDLLKYTPNVEFNNNGPGQGNIFMRGLSTGSQGNQSSATIGNFPNVAVYLDDQSLQFPGRNADVYFADMNRVEVLEGPQGTLFGGGAEAGALRYITNKPDLEKYEGKIEGEYGFQDHGDGIGSGNAMVNLPVVQDKLAVRLVAYDDYEGGYIDNVPSQFSRQNYDAGNSYFGITPNAAGLCPNGQKAGSAGLCSPPNSGPINNYAIAKKDFNPTDFAGFRGSVLGKINEDWDVLIVQSLQDMDTRGSFQDYPIGSNGQALGPLETTQFTPSYDHDRYENTAWTLNGKLADDLKLVYTGSYLVRHISQQVDYTNYSRSAGGMYYQCVGGSTGWKGTPTAKTPFCYSPNSYWHDDVRNTHLSNEIRVSTPDDWRLRAIGGVYQEQFRIQDEMNFNYKTIPDCNPTNLAIALAGGPTCIGNVATAPNSTANDPGPRGNNTAFGEDTQRGYDQIAFFGSIDFDIIPNVLTITAGTRYFQYSEFEVGSQYGTDTACMDVPDGTCVADDKNINEHHDKKVYHGFKNRFNITWHIDPRTIAYYTYSEGFRPGGFNRAQGLVAPEFANKTDDQFNKPNGYAPDSLINNEIGVKTTLLQNRLVLDYSAYYMQWDNTQFLFFDPAGGLGNTSFLVNGPDYQVLGMEGQITARPIEGLTINGSFSANDNSQTSSPCLTDNVAGTPYYGSCIVKVLGKTFINPFGTLNSTSAFSPRFEGSLRGRYDWTVMDKYDMFVQADVNYVGNQYNEPANYTSGAGVIVPGTTLLRYLMPSYETYDASVGVMYKKYSMTLFGNNLGNSRASTYTTSSEFIKAETPLRPRVIGVKLSAAF